MSKMNSGTTPLTESLINYLPAVASSHCKAHEEKDHQAISDSVDESSATHCREIPLSKDRWSDERRPFIKLRKFEDLVLTAEEQDGILSDRIIRVCLSYLEKSPEISRYVLCKCVIVSKDISDLSALEKYHFIQYLDLSNNNLKCLVSLGKLKFLQHLDVSDNFIKNLLDFKAPFGLCYVNYTNNELTSIPDLSDFWSISHLNLSRNEIKEITGLESLRFLTHLDISNNLIGRVENLNGLRIRTLKLDHNRIESCELGETVGLHTLLHLCNLDLSYNSLQSLKFLQMSNNLESLDISNNKIKNMLEVYYLNGLPHLTRLDLSNNPISTEKYYFDVCIRAVQELQHLDDVEITTERKIGSKTKQEIHHSLPSRQNAMEILLLQQINKPSIGSHMVPYDQPPPNVIILVGPPCCRKKYIVGKFVETNARLVAGRSHTTRPMGCDEVNGREYFFISRNEFVDMVRKGEFISTSEFNGYLFGIAYTELHKCIDSVIVFHTDINAAIILRVSGISPKLVLAIPSDEETHMKWLQSRYGLESSPNFEVPRIKNCAVCLNTISHQANDFNSETQVYDSIVEVLETTEDFISKRVSAETEAVCPKEQFSGGTHLYHHIGGSQSKESHEFDFESNISRSVSSKSYPGILKMKPFPCGMGEFDPAPVSSLIEKLGSKRVSFNWIPTVGDDTCFQHPQDNNGHYFSLNSLPFKNDHLNPFGIWNSDEATRKLTALQKTEFMTPPEHFDKMQLETLGRFFKDVINLRKDYLKLHWETFGLFRAVIFTDDETNCLKQLKNILRFHVENQSESSICPSENNVKFEEFLVSKMKKLHL